MMTPDHALLHQKSSRQPAAPDNVLLPRGAAAVAGERANIITLMSGDWHVAQHPGDILVTILGSCVAACIRDPQIGVGGMNHFLLPGDSAKNHLMSDSTRYGVFAMESLINGLLKAGGRKDRFEVKVFGGGNVTNHSARIGSKNANFIRHFLRQEGFRIMSEDLEGDHPRRLHYYPDTGKVMLRVLRQVDKQDRHDERAAIDDETRYHTTIASTPPEGEIELF